MPTTDREYVARTAALLRDCRHGPELSFNQTARDAMELHRLAGTLHRISEMQCSVEMDAATTARVNKREARAEARIRELATAYNCRAYFQGDPRGCPVYLIPAEAGPEADDHADYDRRGHAVPWLGR